MKMTTELNLFETPKSYLESYVDSVSEINVDEILEEICKTSKTKKEANERIKEIDDFMRNEQNELGRFSVQIKQWIREIKIMGVIAWKEKMRLKH